VSASTTWRLTIAVSPVMEKRSCEIGTVVL
jgi:hypothetical protein